MKKCCCSARTAFSSASCRGRCNHLHILEPLFGLNRYCEACLPGATAPSGPAGSGGEPGNAAPVGGFRSEINFLQLWAKALWNWEASQWGWKTVMITRVALNAYFPPFELISCAVLRLPGCALPLQLRYPLQGTEVWRNAAGISLIGKKYAFARFLQPTHSVHSVCAHAWEEQGLLSCM